MQILTIKNLNFEKPFRNPSRRTNDNFLRKKNFGYLSQKIWFLVCSVTVKMFELRNSAINGGKKKRNFFPKFTKGI
jgi:hypothetical protein